jgi:hypothetical protein
MKAFKITNNRPQSAIKQTNNRPQVAMKAVRNSENPEKLKINRNSATPDHGKIQKAQKSSATPAKSGKKFGKFIGQ